LRNTDTIWPKVIQVHVFGDCTTKLMAKTVPFYKNKIDSTKQLHRFENNGAYSMSTRNQKIASLQNSGLEISLVLFKPSKDGSGDALLFQLHLCKRPRGKQQFTNECSCS